jgi:hypothetical protein
LVKAGTRVAVNTSPEPISNIVVSILEDAAVFIVTAVALVAPWVAAFIAAVLLACGLVVVVIFWQAITRYRRSRQRHRAPEEP